MTHEELLADIDNRVINEESDTSNYLALRAVVELHRNVGGWCDQCAGDYEFPARYPCSTIQAIKKELYK